MKPFSKDELEAALDHIKVAGAYMNSYVWGMYTSLKAKYLEVDTGRVDENMMRFIELEYPTKENN